MAIQPIGVPQPVKLANAPLAVAREVVRLTQEQNQRVRESRLEDGDDADRAALRAEEAADDQSRPEDVPDESAGQPQNDSPRSDSRGETLDILA